MTAGQGTELLDQLRGLLLGQEFRRQNRVCEQLQLCQIESAGADRIAGVFPGRADDITAEFLETLDIPIKAFSLCADLFAPDN